MEVRSCHPWVVDHVDLVGYVLHASHARRGRSNLEAGESGDDSHDHGRRRSSRREAGHDGPSCHSHQEGLIGTHHGALAVVSANGSVMDALVAPVRC